MANNHEDVVNRVNQSHPELLKWNTTSSCAEFIQRVVNEPEMKSERWGLLSKSDGEAGYTFPNGIRCSHDVIALPNGERVDVIQSADGHPVAGGPTWQEIPEYDGNGNLQWRPHNVWVDVSSWPIYESDAPDDVVTENNTVLAFGWFCWMRAWAEWPNECQENYKWLMDNMGPKVFRVMLAVEGESHSQGNDPDVWRDAGVFITDDWENRYKKMLDQVGNAGQQVHCTVYGGRNQTPTYTDRYNFHDRIIRASEGRWQAIRSFEMMNEYLANAWTEAEVIDAGNDLGSKLPAGMLLSLSSPCLAHSYVEGQQPTNEEMEASFDALYKDHRYANEVTIHTMRDGQKWSDPFSYNIFYQHLPHLNNEPPGPGSSAGGMHTTADDVRKDFTNTINAGWPLYVGHSEWSVWNGHLPVEYYNGWREIKFLKDLPNMLECAHVMRELNTGEVHMAKNPYPDEQTWWKSYEEEVVKLFKKVGREVPREALESARFGYRTSWDLADSLSPDDSKKKHLEEMAAELGTTYP